MTELFLQTGHLSDEGLQALIDGTLDEMQRLEAAEHLSFCDECLTRYTALLTGDVLEEPEQDVTLPVMRRLRRRAVKSVWNRYAAAAAAVVITAGLWYSGVFGGAMEALAIQPPALEQRERQTERIAVVEVRHGVVGAGAHRCDHRDRTCPAGQWSRPGAPAQGYPPAGGAGRRAGPGKGRRPGSMAEPVP